MTHEGTTQVLCMLSLPSWMGVGHLGNCQEDLWAVCIALVGTKPMAYLLELGLVVWAGCSQAVHQIASQQNIAGVGTLALLENRGEGSHGDPNQLAVILLHLHLHYKGVITEAVPC